MATAKKNTSSTKNSSSKALASKLAGVSSAAKSLGIDTRKADAMVKQTEREGSKSFSGSKEETALNKSFAITPERLTPQNTPPVVPTPKITDPGDVIGSGNIGLATGMEGTELKDGMFVSTPTEPTSSTDTTGYEKNFQSYMQNIMGNKPVDNEAIYNKAEKEVGLNKAQKEVNNYTSQINSIVAESQAAQLGLEGQGRGITETIIGGQQAQINREAAIKALPVQALLSAAQGNLEFAQQRLDTLFKIRSADAQAKYDFNNKIYSTYYDFANTMQKSKLDALKLKEDRLYDERKSAISDAKNIAMQAIEYGQTGLAGKIMNLDSNSPTYASEVLSMMGKLSKPVTATKRDTAFDKDGNLVDMQTGEILSQAGGGAVDTQKQQQINETLGLARELLGDGGFWDQTGKSSAIGASLAKFVPFGQSLGLQGDRTSFENKVNTLKANLTLDNLSLLKGPMSDKDLAFLQAIGSSISTNMSEKEFDTQVKKVVQKLEEKSAVVTPSGTRILTAPDGIEVEIID